MKGASIKNNHSLFSEYFQSGDLNGHTIEKRKLKSIASRVRSNPFYLAVEDVDPRLKEEGLPLNKQHLFSFA